jgi:hypothetical protein
MQNKLTDNMTLRLYLSQIVPLELFVVSVLAFPSNFRKNESVSILQESSLETNENRLTHEEYRRNTR